MYYILTHIYIDTNIRIHKYTYIVHIWTYGYIHGTHTQIYEYINLQIHKHTNPYTHIDAYTVYIYIDYIHIVYLSFFFSLSASFVFIEGRVWHAISTITAHLTDNN